MDNALATLGATTVFRSDVDHMYDKYFDDRIDKVNKKIAVERAKIKSAVAAEESTIQQKIEQLKEKRRKRFSELK